MLGVCIHIHHLYQLYFIDLNIFISLFQTVKTVNLSRDNWKIWNTLLKNRKFKIQKKPLIIYVMLETTKVIYLLCTVFHPWQGKQYASQTV